MLTTLIRWGPLIVGPALVCGLFPQWQYRAWVFMWLLAVAIYAGCKWLTFSNVRTSAPAWKQAGYLLLWPGMNAERFLNGPPEQTRPLIREWLGANAKLVFGLALLWVAAAQGHPETSMEIQGWAPEFLHPDPLLRGWLGMAGVVFVLHFGVFHLLSLAWRCLGVRAEPLMQAPILSESLTEFWGRRWNVAFRDLTHQFLFRPLAVRLGPKRALWVGFLVSGLVHDLVISLPAGGGAGGPTVFFLLQAAGISVERSRRGRSWGLSRGVRGWLWTVVFLVAPAPLLFHAPFITRIILPMLGTDSLQAIVTPIGNEG